MFLMEKASNSLAEKISKELNYDEDKKEVIAYGAYAILEIILSIFFVVLFGWIFGVLTQALVVSVFGAGLRRYTGGVHASSPAICIIVGTVTCVGFALLSKLSFFTNFWLVSALVLGTHLLAFWLIYRLAPVASENKPISDKKKPKLKRGGLVLNLVYLLISAIVIALSVWMKRPALLTYPVCISLGVLWQVFSITHLGGVWLGAIDRLLSRKTSEDNIG